MKTTTLFVFLIELCKRDLNPQSNRKVLICAKKSGT